MLKSRSEVLTFVSEVSARYGSLNAFFAQLRAEVDRFDDAPTLRLPIIPTPSPAAWSATTSRDNTTPPPATTFCDNVTPPPPPQTQAARPRSTGKHRSRATAAWTRLTGRAGA
ncbi:hypothetical protein [Nocardia blacklockiae]|uniref:hypothetical protein n=1 Tax=Nocardia blacklockiae TaxID=480036 RepID=UPI0018955F94|nr:hypothetical protein [Nocardia blacklockiae]MBF6175687.1 hypothetical protein [Nocardia blacklockiae]